VAVSLPGRWRLAKEISSTLLRCGDHPAHKTGLSDGSMLEVRFPEISNGNHSGGPFGPSGTRAIAIYANLLGLGCVGGRVPVGPPPYSQCRLDPDEQNMRTIIPVSRPAGISVNATGDRSRKHQWQTRNHCLPPLIKPQYIKDTSCKKRSGPSFKADRVISLCAMFFGYSECAFLNSFQ